jgi:protein-L-isoaspartate(D-aspartate) O-methyltransferase
MIMEANHASVYDLANVLRERGVLTDSRLEAAFTAVPRHLFLPNIPLNQVYADLSIPLRSDISGETICSATMPSMIARMLAQLDVQPGHNVLQIGTGTGYTAALLRHLVGESGRITTMEIEREITNIAQDNLLRAAVHDVRVVHDDGAWGYAPRAAYDRIVASVGVWDIPPAWVQQLKPDGRIVAPMWLDGLQVSAGFRLLPDATLTSEINHPSAFVYIRGAAAGPRVRKRIGSTALTLIADGVDKVDSAALHVLLSADYEASRLNTPLNTSDYWYGFLPYVMLNETDTNIFALYDVLASQKAYGLEGEGFALFTPASACFVPYYGLGFVQNFAGADAFIEVETYLDSWQRAGCPGIDRLRLQLIPRAQGEPAISSGKLYTRSRHYLHVWLDGVDDAALP